MGEQARSNPRLEAEQRRLETALGEYFGALDGNTASVRSHRKRDLLRAYAEYRYQVRGGTHCTTCGTPVRYFMTVEIERTDGIVAHYAALCTRCLAAEIPSAESVTLRLGTLEYKTLFPRAPRPRGQDAVE
jgi:hypothetical protein